DVGERKLGVAEHLLDVLKAAAEEIAVRREAGVLLEGASEMVRRKAGHGGQGIEADFFADVRLDEVADPMFHRGREAASAEVWRFGHEHEAEHAQARLRMDDGFGPIAREIGFGQRRSEQCAPVFLATSAREQDGNVLAAAAAEEGWTVVEER